MQTSWTSSKRRSSRRRARSLSRRRRRSRSTCEKECTVGHHLPFACRPFQVPQNVRSPATCHEVDGEGTVVSRHPRIYSVRKSDGFLACPGSIRYDDLRRHRRRGMWRLRKGLVQAESAYVPEIPCRRETAGPDCRTIDHQGNGQMKSAHNHEVQAPTLSLNDLSKGASVVVDSRLVGVWRPTLGNGPCGPQWQRETTLKGGMP